MSDGVKKILYFLRNIVFREAITAIKVYAYGDILDVGGGEFYKEFFKLDISCKTYTIVDKKEIKISEDLKERVSFEQMDATHLTLSEGSFDTVLCIHMLEHTMKPLEVILEIKKVLKIGGLAIFLVPQTSVPHDIPSHYYNFTRYFMEEALIGNGFKIIKIKMLGGLFLTLASNLFHFPLFLFDRLYRDERIKRGALFYLSLPIKLILFPFLFVILFILSAGDIKEVANNILVVAKKE